MSASTPTTAPANVSAGSTMDALTAFENAVRADPVRGIMPDYFLKKLKSYDPANPEFLDRMVDHDWQIFRQGWLACMAHQSA